MGAVTVTNLTIALVDDLLPRWQELTKTEDARALVAREAVNALLDLRSFTDEFSTLDIAAKTAA